MTVRSGRHRALRRRLQIVMNGSGLAVTTVSLADGEVNSAYLATLTATGGTARLYVGGNGGGVA